MIATNLSVGPAVVTHVSRMDYSLLSTAATSNTPNYDTTVKLK
jgi:hypothetical protein